MTRTVELEQRRTGWDIVLGLVLLVVGIVVLGHAVIATVVSILFIGWMALLGGIVVLVATVVRIGRGATWSAALGGGLLVVLGLFMLRNTDVAAVTLVIAAGALFLAGGVVRLVVAAQEPEARWVLVLSGVASLALGLIVLFNVVEASFTLLGVLLGIDTIIEGLTLALVGRVRPVRDSTA